MKRLSVLLPVAAGVLWGSAGLFVRTLGAAGMDSITILSVRMLISAVILGIGILIYDRKLLKFRLKDGWIFICAAILGMVGLSFCYNIAIEQLSLSFAAVLLGMTPIFVSVIAAFVFKEKITRRKVLCTIAAIIGCVLVSGVIGGAAVSFSVSGILLGLGAALCCAVYAVLSRVAAGRGYHVLTTTFYSIFIGAIAVIAVTDWGVVGAYISASYAPNIIFLILHAICMSALPYVIYTISLAINDMGKAALLTSATEPCAAMLFGLFLFDETPTVITCLGLVITIAALCVLCLPEKPDKSKA